MTPAEPSNNFTYLFFKICAGRRALQKGQTFIFQNFNRTHGPTKRANGFPCPQGPTPIENRDLSKFSSREVFLGLSCFNNLRVFWPFVKIYRVLGLVALAVLATYVLPRLDFKGSHPEFRLY